MATRRNHPTIPRHCHQQRQENFPWQLQASTSQAHGHKRSSRTFNQNQIFAVGRTQRSKRQCQRSEQDSPARPSIAENPWAQTHLTAGGRTDSTSKESSLVMGSLLQFPSSIKAAGSLNWGELCHFLARRHRCGHRIQVMRLRVRYLPNELSHTRDQCMLHFGIQPTRCVRVSAHAPRTPANRAMHRRHAKQGNHQEESPTKTQKPENPKTPKTIKTLRPQEPRPFCRHPQARARGAQAEPTASAPYL